jgi:hypothetical protein
MMPTLDKRLNSFIDSLESKYNREISKDFRVVLTKDISVGYQTSNTFESATELIEQRFIALLQTEPEAV